ncbi:hypothetical protein [Streptomyces sp. MI02-7b]|uniref:hypothetical protein n=1 Tax=Streptomyces sp. MI02-7b TaxID=462941 RepID=UPI0029A379C3|nr:hypothetical protein [Streptomyces sp. MI02-7b]MDX3073445.1 hypothetical protein [Streptomyces sp. MI02-7b]
MADETELGRRLAGLAESGQGLAVPLAAHQVRARGERRLRRRRTAAAGGVALLACALVAGGVTLAGSVPGPRPAAVTPAPAPPPFTTPSPAPDEEYAAELGRVYDAVAQGDSVRVTVEQLRAGPGGTTPTGAVHTLTLPGATLVEARLLSGGHRSDLRLSELVGRLAGGPRWTFAIDYDTEGRVVSLREAEE